MVARKTSRSLPFTATLLFATLLDTVNSHALPRATPTVPLREFDVQLWPLEPTAAPLLPHELLRRQFNTICGYIGGDSALPATCSAGSHCAADSENGIIGCCPDDGPCTQGIFTGCVDGNSDPQTELNPYVYTCSGSDVCYQNQFDGGFAQFGCGSASSLANTVATAVSGGDSLTFDRVSAELTASATSLSEPTTIGTRTRSRSSRSSSESSRTRSSTETESSTTSESSTSESSTQSSSDRASSTTATSSTESSTEAASAPDNDDDNSTNVGAVVGGAVGGVAGVALILTLAIWLWRRRSRNSRQGPGLNQSTEYITPMTDNRQQEFTQLPTTWEEPEPDLPPAALGGVRPGVYNGYRYDSNSSGSTRGTALGGSGPYEPDREPLTGELDDFSRGFNTAIDDIDGADETHPNGQGMGAYTRPKDGSRPLWQQNRRRSRNLMWM